MNSSFEALLGQVDGSPPPVPSIQPPPARGRVEAVGAARPVASTEPAPRGPEPPIEPVASGPVEDVPPPDAPDVGGAAPSPSARVESPLVERATGEPAAGDSRPRVGFDLPELDPEGAVRPMVDPADAERVVAEAVERAREEAFMAGVDEGMKRERSRLDAARGALTAAVAALVDSDERRASEAEERIRVLAAGVAAHIVEREVRASPDLVSDLVRRAIAEFPVNDPLRVHLNPADIALLTGESSGDLGGGRSVRWMPDPNIQSGGCLIEGSEQVVDARLPKTLERIIQALIDD